MAVPLQSSSMTPGIYLHRSVSGFHVLSDTLPDLSLWVENCGFGKISVSCYFRAQIYLGDSHLPSFESSSICQILPVVVEGGITGAKIGAVEVIQLVGTPLAVGVLQWPVALPQTEALPKTEALRKTEPLPLAEVPRAAEKLLTAEIPLQA